MFVFRQVLYRDLGCASYIVGEAGGSAAVVDPRWDIATYLEIAREDHLTIDYVLDTHHHADHVSGRRRLAAATGARSYHAVEARNPAVDGIRPGEEITIGSVRLRALGTPGHRPEHLSFAVFDLARGEDVWMVLTGDSLLVGDLARPDLAVDAQSGAERMFSSLGSLIELGDHVEVWPAHVGGSLCGGARLSGKTSSTIGFERIHNPLLMASRDVFVRGLTEAIPPRPPNVERIVAINRDGAVAPRDAAALSAAAAGGLVASHITVLDARMPELFDSGHLAGAVNLPVGAHGTGTRAGWSVRPDESVLVAAVDEEMARQMVSVLQAVGLWEIAGYLVGDGEDWSQAGLPVARADSWDLDQLAGGLRRHEVDLIDVREQAEWVAGHVPGSFHMPIERFRAGNPVPLPDNGHGRTTAVACAAGNRAAFAASLLRRAGRENVVRVAGGGIADLGSRGIDLDVGA